LCPVAPVGACSSAISLQAFHMSTFQVSIGRGAYALRNVIRSLTPAFPSIV
jgi:hypothetical protein